ncbi:hypothetical protein A3D05_04445 [Candidatus Gottesmanbacteria bacterium RIFCSPHIGHO2_02_FULL_40_24]|uniref:Spore coat protein n=1 Tax=Candidatus Gottesmanbacteria bacterium RIFCSPHIGHO2_01_FULL_40_15 TaxID=1798376 RepID=A0A1F5Z364_9BACT|nr:MAG: hypothetical protein A2777_05475 [Candidatus Gottesmanbacteria bacterium RIFCSPHIGHO2_01_FULL_40_15]OGG16241.1 MAG: hypothetical protein A3D05_04445 [Candidatus Gottesmanbacteria bacterium RIFCSPHIGHO2_02_FULL_40_24]OGG20874.1 MAG: hypothetical protein A3B48_06690 [Candidatus Gottesmanbacteria bacterium RIFCSPLOWO2_01_FULL_40_10]OGG25910.1 MAG: hypothetical protein A3E42_05715 [Candidatus Gottesmanbacteria bacterium RIFCSPHIGHO2_12_FULL_40_13]OGG32348.1 MAG: hypothetical protein A3I80_0
MISGVTVKQLIRHRDDRGFFEELIRITDDFFSEGFGQLSHSYMYTGTIKAWHVHYKQVDWWYCIKGDLKVALCDVRPESQTFGIINQFQIGEHSQNIILKIPPGVAHGCKVAGGSAELLYVTSGIYDPAEEGRIAHDDKNIGFDWLMPPDIK